MAHGPTEYNGCIDRHAGDPSFLDLQTFTQKPCADSSTMGCNGAVSCSKKHPPPSLPPPSSTSALPPSLSFSIPPPQMKTGPHRGCRHLIGWAIAGVDGERGSERERESVAREGDTKKMQLLCHSIPTERWAWGMQEVHTHKRTLAIFRSRFCPGFSSYRWTSRITSSRLRLERALWLEGAHKQQLGRQIWSSLDLSVTWTWSLPAAGDCGS